MANPYDSRVWLYKRYHEDRVGIAAMANEAGVTVQTIYNWLKKYRIV